jgi:hypothetical protein
MAARWWLLLLLGLAVAGVVRGQGGAPDTSGEL